MGRPVRNMYTSLSFFRKFGMCRLERLYIIQEPQTVVIDADGVITYNAVGSVTYEVLERLLTEAGA